MLSQKAEGAGAVRHTGARGKARATGARLGNCRRAQVRRGSSNDSRHGPAALHLQVYLPRALSTAKWLLNFASLVL